MYTNLLDKIKERSLSTAADNGDVQAQEELCCGNCHCVLKAHTLTDKRTGLPILRFSCLKCGYLWSVGELLSRRSVVPAAAGQ